MRPLTLAYDPKNYPEFEAATLLALGDGYIVIVGLDQLTKLGSADARRLIDLWRRVRDVGAKLFLRTDRSDILREIESRALDCFYTVIGTAVA